MKTYSELLRLLRTELEIERDQYSLKLKHETDEVVKKQLRFYVDEIVNILKARRRG